MVLDLLNIWRKSARRSRSNSCYTKLVNAIIIHNYMLLYFLGLANWTEQRRYQNQQVKINLFVNTPSIQG